MASASEFEYDLSVRNYNNIMMESSSQNLTSIENFDDFLLRLSAVPELDQIVLEIGVLQSIYGEKSVSVWDASTSTSFSEYSLEESNEPIRYELHTSLPPPYDESEDTNIRVLVSLPRTYPTTSPPQLQLLSRYIGAFGVDAGLFGSVLRTFMSKEGTQWVPDNVCVFDGMENVRELCASWYTERLSEEKTTALHSQNEKTNEVRKDISLVKTIDLLTVNSQFMSSLPSGIRIVEAEPIIDRKSAFIGRACRIFDPSQISLVIAHLMSDRRIARAAHPVINAWRCRVDGLLHQDNDDDGEVAAGGRLAHLLQILDIENVLVVVTRYFGGIHLGPDRFKHINQAARNALVIGGFLDTSGDSKQNSNPTKQKKR